MILTIGVQLTYFFSTVVAGLIVGVLFDIYRIFRGERGSGKVIVAISDLLFWIFEALVVFVFLLATNSGDIRYYTFIGIILGCLIYFKLLSKIVITILIRILKIIYKTFNIIINVLIFPFKLIFHGYGMLSVNIIEKSSEIHRKRKKIKGENNLKEKQIKKEENNGHWKNKLK